MADKEDPLNPYSYQLGQAAFFQYNAPGSPASTNGSPAPSSPSLGGGAYSHGHQIYSTGVAPRYPGQLHFGSKLSGHVQLNHSLLANSAYQQQLGLSSHAATTSIAASNAVSVVGVGGVGQVTVAGPHHQKQVETAALSRQTGSPHHHARVAAAAARTSLANGTETNGVNGGSSAVNGEARASEWTIIDLGGMQMKNLGKELFRYTFLTTLYLNYNALSYLPPEINRLRSLTVLDVSGNKLASVPPELGMLVALRELLMFDNELTYLPPELGNLYMLETLGLEGNPLNDPIMGMIQKDGTTAVIQYLRDMCPVGPMPADRDWILLEEDAYGAAANDSFTVMCYNTLCEKYATAQAYAYTPAWALSWDYRKDLLLQDILNYNADVVCLQEVEAGQYEEYFHDQLQQHGEYEGVFWPKSRSRTMSESERRQVDGCATFWKSSKFSLIEKHCVEFQQIAMQRPELRKNADVFNRVMIKDNIAVVTLLENKETHARVMVANAHLHWDPQYRDVKLVQTAMLLEELGRLEKVWAKLAAREGTSSATTNGSSNSGTRLPLVIGGDFNSLPDSGVYEFLSSGHVPQDHEDFGSYTYGPYTSEGLDHKFSLKSAYSHVNELDFTNFTPTFKGVIDYVWYSTNLLSVTGLLGNVDREYVSRTVGFPNAHHPSDHIPLVVQATLKRPETQRKVFFNKD
ncbi:Glucose-repressible alcohol dehydrogenase transcriptional effector [Borealophlyctis nickersoniae]|nr:Glucose-repressible alcohol dehydrogenase transcriptional effector [Borealophlyctis nickersoniae]